ncbi:MAG: two-component response regulator MtrA [Actinomycetota bacterium]
MFTLLFIEDDEAIRTALRLVLEDEGYEVAEAGDGETGIKMFGQMDPDLVLLDLRLPDISGFEVCRAIRRTSITPVIMVTAQTDTSDLVNGFDAGADDYVTKPVVPKELAARIRAALRRTQTVESSPSGPKSLNKIGDVEIDRNLSIVKKAGVEIALTKTEYRLLVEFADHPGMVMSRDQLLERVWGYEYLGDSRLVDAHVRRLRVKVETQPEEPTMIVTVRGMGYRLLN